MQLSRVAFGTRRLRRLWPLVAVATMSADQAPPVNVPGIDKPVIVVTGEITGHRDPGPTRTTTSCAARCSFDEGATLNIEAGTRIIGESGSVGTLIVLRGGRLNAIGTAAGADRLHERPADRAARTAATGAVSSSTAARRSTSRAARAPARATPASTAAPTRTTTAACCDTCASSSRASSSARTTS